MLNRKIIKYLEEWRRRRDRKPLILRGARQVGKTASIQMFGEKYFKNFVALNLEDPEQEPNFRNSISLDEFEKIIRIKYNASLQDGETLLFIDEIQNSPPLINLLRFFYEKRPNLHVVAAGSLLEVMLKKKGFAFPVGRVEYAYLHPFDFFEFLEAKKESALLESLNAVEPASPLPSAVHEMALRLFNEYLLIGGMPEIVDKYVKNHDFPALNRIYNSLLTAYQEDIYKYASEAKTKYLTYCLENVPSFAGQTITYEHFGGSNYRSREMSEAFETLEKAMLVYQARASNSSSLPLIPKRKKAPKLIFLDSGLMSYRLGLREGIVNPCDLNDVYRGRLAEQITGQQLMALEPDSLTPIFYWYRDTPGSTAEIDYMLAIDGKAIALEIKSGKTGRLRSLKEFVKISGVKTAYRIYGGHLSSEPIRQEEINYNLVSIPFYLLPRLKGLVQGQII